MAKETKKKSEKSNPKQVSDDDLKLLIAKRIKRIRGRLGYTAKRVANELGISRSALSQIETGRIHINAVTLCKLAYILKCNVEEFFPKVPNSSSLTESDITLVAQENEQAAEFLKKAFNSK
jgi:transcriptional regulator with XRE-family HTH domain